MAEKIATPPFIPGHEGCGIVVGRGEGVDIPLGVRVIPDSHVPCNRSTCHHCTHDARHLCPSMVLLGHHIDGVFAQYVVVPAHACYALRTALPARLACVLEPFGVAYRTVEMIEPVAGETVLISGCGPIGLFAAAVCKKRGALKVIACDITDYRLGIAKQVGADLCLNTAEMSAAELGARLLAESEEIGPSCIIEASGAPIMVNNSFTWIRKRGRMCFVGLPKGVWRLCVEVCVCVCVCV
jgi:threonine 3-dehydrogenase